MNSTSSRTPSASFPSESASLSGASSSAAPVASASASAGASESAARRLAFRSSWRQTLLELLVLSFFAVLLACAYPGINWDGAAWFALLPLFWIIRGKSALRAGVYGFFFGYVWNLVGCFWLREIFVLIPFVFAAVLGAFTGFWAALVPFFFRNLAYPPSVRLGGAERMAEFYRFHPVMEIAAALSLSAWWVCLEWIRSWIFTGFPWNLLGISQWKNAIIIQICEYTGVYGVSFLLIFMNLALFFALHGFWKSSREGKYKRPYPLILAFLGIIFCTWFGRGKLEEYEARRGEYSRENTRLFPVGVVQPNLTQRRDPLPGQEREALETCLSLSRELLEKSSAGREEQIRNFLGESLQNPSSESLSDPARLGEMLPLALLVWPETAVPTAYRGGSVFAAEYRQRLKALLDEAGIPFLIGSPDFGEIRSQTDFDLLNSALLLHPGKEPLQEIADRYSKVRIVPFGEFVPLGEIFPVLPEWIGMGRNLTPGPGFRPLEVGPGVRAGISICYEDVFPHVSRGHVLAGANLLLVITNDAWYPTSFEPDQHFANSIFRAVENRLPMLRCGNSNYSVLVDPAGRLADCIYKQYDSRRRKEILMPEIKGSASAKFMVEVPLKHTPTFYARYGNVFVLFCWLLFASGGAAALFRWRQVAQAIASPFELSREELRASMRRLGK